MLDELFQKASKAYYEGNPIMSDAEFDCLFAHFNGIGYKVTDGINHYYPMWSLQKCFDLEKAPLNLRDCISSPKLDGAAVSLLYVNGSFTLGLTRGDGVTGKDATDKLATLVPSEIPIPGIIQITGEVVCPLSVENARNVAAGSLNLKSVEAFASRPLEFVAYDAQKTLAPSWTEAMNILNSIGFNTVLYFDHSNYPKDGTVYRLNDYESFYEQGYTAKHPRGAFALKEAAQGVSGTLLDVTWQVGKSGVVSPVAILEPVEVGGATVQRATLHNIEYIRELNLEIGCKVEIIRSGEIIPRVVRRLD